MVISSFDLPISISKVPIFRYTRKRKKKKRKKHLLSSAMDLLCNAYSNDSDEDDEPMPKPQKLSSPPSKRPKLDAQIARPEPGRPPTRSPMPGIGAPIAGRYVSKRERAISGALSLPRAREPDDVAPASLGICFSLFFFFFFFFKPANLL